MHQPLARLQKWYAAQCDGDWEHRYGITLSTLDNPGWSLEVDLAETELESAEFAEVVRGDCEEDVDWVHCRVEDGRFVAAGGIPNLPELLETFLAWADR